MPRRTFLPRSAFVLITAALSVFGTRAQQDVTQPGDAIIPSSANSPASEAVANAIDGKTTKYLNFDSGQNNLFKPSGFIVTPSVGLTRVTGLAMQSANDSPNRDPKHVTLEGSNDDQVSAFNSGNWEMIADIPNITAWTVLYPDPDTTDNFDPSRFQTQTFSFPNLKPYKHYRWTVTETQTTPNNCCMQIAEVEFLGTVVPQDVTQPGDAIIPSSANSPASEAVANAIDNKTTKYLNFDSGQNNVFKPSGFVVTPSVGKTLVTGIAMQSANDSPNRDPKTITLEGSNDDTITSFSGGNWTFITGITNITAWTTLYPDPDTTDNFDPSRFQTQTFLFDNVTPYKHYRWVVTETQTTPNNCCMQIAEVELLGTSAPQDVTQPGDAIIPSSANSPASEAVANAIDNKTTKYLNFDSGQNNLFKPSGFVVTPSVGPTTVIGLAMQSANDSPNRDPKHVILEGSNDDQITAFNSGTWEPIADIPNITPWTTLYPDPDTTDNFDPSRFQTQEFYFPNQKSYKHYRWTVTETQTTPNNCCMQIAEVEFLAVTSTAPESARFLSQPIDTPVIEGQPATFFVDLNGPWPVQWYKNSQPIPGATKTTYTTDPVTSQNQTNVYTVQIVGREESVPVHAAVFTPSATKSIGVHFVGGGANGAPTLINTNDVMGVQPQAYWNNATDANGDLPGTDTAGNPVPLKDSDNQDSSITFHYESSGTWGSGTGVDRPTQRLLNGTIGATGPGTDTILAFGNVPPGSHSVLLYVVSPPLQFQNVSYKITGATEKTYYIRAMNSDEYNAAPGWYRGSSTDPNNPTKADFVRFDGVQPDAGGNITITISTLTTAAQRTGVNAVQLVLNAPNPGAPPEVTANPEPTVVQAGGTARLSVTATGNNLTYQWLKNGRTLPNGGNVSGADTATLNIASFSPADEAIYSVAVFNPAGSSLSKNAAALISAFNINSALAVYLKFDEASGSTAANSVAGGSPGNVIGTPAWGPGKINNALTLDGNTYVQVANYKKATNQFGVSLWVNVPAGTTDSALVRNAEGDMTVTSGSLGQFELRLITDANDGSLHLDAQIGIGPNIYRATAASPFPTDAWHQVGMSADGAQLRLYVDGVEVAATEYLGNFSPADIQYLSIGARLAKDSASGDIVLDANPTALIGSIDDLGVWNRVLTASEMGLITTAGNQGKPLSSVTESAPAGDITITAVRNGTTLTITWTNGGTLQSSPNLGSTAVWTPVAGQTAGSASVQTTASAHTFFRVTR
jgi:hypothetical protein